MARSSRKGQVAAPQAEGQSSGKRLNTFAKRVRNLREQMGMRQEDFIAELERVEGLRMTQGYLSKLENSSSIPSGEIVGHFARRLRTTSDYLLLLTDDPRPLDQRLRSTGQPAQHDEVTQEVVELMRGVSPAARQDILSVARALVRQVQFRKDQNRDRWDELLDLAQEFGGEDMRRRFAEQLGTLHKQSKDMTGEAQDQRPEPEDNSSN